MKTMLLYREYLKLSQLTLFSSGRIINVSWFREMIRESRCAVIYGLLRLQNDLGMCSY